MPQAVRCPVCYGSGKYIAPEKWGIPTPPPHPCHGCAGRGWVEVGDAPLSAQPPQYPRANVTYSDPKFSILTGGGASIGIRLENASGTRRTVTHPV